MHVGIFIVSNSNTVGNNVNLYVSIFKSALLAKQSKIIISKYNFFLTGSMFHGLTVHSSIESSFRDTHDRNILVQSVNLFTFGYTCQHQLSLRITTTQKQITSIISF